MALIKDVAERAQVSTSTVSLVINNKSGISESTRTKVFEAINELGYNIKESKASASKQKNIQFVFYKKHGNIVADTPFFYRLLEGVEREVKKNGYRLLISYVDERFELDEQIIKVLREDCVGIILLSTEMTRDDLTPFLKSETPLIMVDNYFEDLMLDSVVINNMQGAFLATKHLYDNGHKKIGYIKSKYLINNFAERSAGYKKALKQSHVKYNEDYIFAVGATTDTAYHDMKRHIEKGIKLPTAFFVDNDIIAMGAMKALKEHGYKIPDDISFVGFDDAPLCEMVDPPLTTVRVAKKSMGSICVDRLMKICEKDANEAKVKIEVHTTLIQRKSVQKK